ncbi:MAG TPA: hypothetical protein PLW49_02085 [bacterium]|nr:hypothetical protein [bacterium]
MANLTNKQKSQLQHIFSRLTNAENFIKKENVLIFTHGQNEPINKEIGSDLCYLYRAKEELQYFLENN